MPPSVLTILVTTVDNDRFRETLTAAQQQSAPNRIICVDASTRGVLSASDPHIENHAHTTYYQAKGARNLACAINETLTDPAIASLYHSADFLWILHADSTPTADTLECLIDAVSAGSSIAVVGPKQVAPDGSLLEVGITATRSGHRLETALPGERDQGQYDGRQDVLAVGSAGMLIRTDVWKESGGFDTALSPFGEGFELCRRVRLMGHRVVVDTRAKLIHERETVDGSPRQYRLWRRSVVYMRWLIAPWWLLPFVLIASLISTCGRFLWDLGTLRPRRAWGEVWALLSVVGDVAHVVRRRFVLHRQARVPRSALSGVELTYKDVWSRRRWVKKRFARLEGQEVEAALVETLEQYRRRRRRAGWVLTGFVALVSLLVWLPFIRQGLTFEMTLHAPGWVELPRQWSILWENAWSPATAAFTQVPVSDPFVLLLAIMSAPIGLAGYDPNTLLYALFVLSLPMSVASMWWATGCVSGRLGVRAMAAIFWGAQPVLWLSLMNAQISTLLLHSLIPAVCVTMLRVLGLRRHEEVMAESTVVVFTPPLRRRWWAVNALVFAAVAMAMPVLGLLAAVVLAGVSVAALIRPRWSLDSVEGRQVKSFLPAAWVSLLPAALVCAPYIVAIIRSGAYGALLSSPGRPFIPQGLTEGAPLLSDIFLGMPARVASVVLTGEQVGLYEGIVLGALALPPIVMMVLALWCVIRSQGKRPLVAAGAIALFSMLSLCAVMTEWIPIGMNEPEWTGLVSANTVRVDGYTVNTPIAYSDMVRTTEELVATHREVTAWVGSWLTCAAAILILAIAYALPRSWQGPGTNRLLILLGALSILVMSAASHNILPLAQPLAPMVYGNGYALPASLSAAHRDNGTRSLIVIASPDRYYAYTQETNAPNATAASTITRYQELHTPELSAGNEDFTQALATLVTTPDTTAVRDLAAQGIDSILLPYTDTPPMRALEDTLALNDAIEQGPQTSALHVWRLRPDGQVPTHIQSAHTPLWVHLWQGACALTSTILLFGIRPRRSSEMVEPRKKDTVTA